MKKSARISALVLSLLLLLSACSENTDGNSSNTNSSETGNTSAETESESAAEETEEEKILPDIPATADYGDDEIKFLVWERAGWAQTVRQFRDIYSEGITGDSINDAVYNRNSKIEDAYKIKIAQERVSDATICSVIQTSVTAGEKEYDVVYPRLNEAAGIFTKGILQNLMNVPNIDLSKPWWDDNCVNSLSVNGFLPCASTSLNVNDKDATAAIAFNKDLAEQHNIENLYDIVREGKWTYDKLSEIADIADQDTNGDGELTVDDIYGFLGGRDVTESFYYGSGSLMVTKDENEQFVFTYGTERDINVTESIINLMHQPWFMNHHLISNTDDNYYRELFETGHGLFFWMRLDEVTNMRASDTNFGILPIPKYEESQDGYHSLVSKYITGLPSIPITVVNEELEEVGLVLEALSADSYYSLIPEYIESTLKTKYSRDAESADMVDIIINNRVFAPMHIYNFGSFSGSFLTLGDKADTSLSSFLKGKEKVVQKNIEKTMEVFLDTAQ